MNIKGVVENCYRSDLKFKLSEWIKKFKNLRRI